MPEGIKEVAVGGFEPPTKGLTSPLLAHRFNSNLPSHF